MSGFFPERARGERLEGGLPAPPRPDEDERWDYVADHLRAIRSNLGILAFVAAMQILALVCAFIVWATTDQGGSSGF